MTSINHLVWLFVTRIQQNRRKSAQQEAQSLNLASPYSGHPFTIIIQPMYKHPKLIYIITCEHGIQSVYIYQDYRRENATLEARKDEQFSNATEHSIF